MAGLYVSVNVACGWWRMVLIIAAGEICNVATHQWLWHILGDGVAFDQSSRGREAIQYVCDVCGVS